MIPGIPARKMEYTKIAVQDEAWAAIFFEGRCSTRKEHLFPFVLP